MRMWFAAFERHEPRTWDFGGERASLIVRNARVIARMHDECWDAHFLQQMTHVDRAERLENASRDVGSRRRAHEIAEPTDLLGARIGNEQRCEELAERGILLTPPFANEDIERLAASSRFFVALRPAFGVATVENQVRDALGMPHCVLDARCAALRDAEQWEAIDTHRVDERFEIRNLCLVRQVGNVPIRKAASARVESNELAASREELKPMPPDGTVPVEFQVRQPIGRFHEGRAAAGGRHRQAGAVGRLDEANRLLHRRAADSRMSAERGPRVSD